MSYRGGGVIEKKIKINGVLQNDVPAVYCWSIFHGAHMSLFFFFHKTGIDAETAYTRNDFKTLKGDVGLRKQVKLTKTMLGYCTPIVLESNG